MLENWNSSFNLPVYSNFYSEYSHSYQKDNYKCKTIDSGKPNGRFAENAGFINPGNYQLSNLLEVPDNIPAIVIPGNTIITTCSDSYEKVESCAVYRCVKQGFCVFYLNTGKLPVWADVIIDIFITDPFGRFYLEEHCTLIGIDFSCVFCDSEAQANSFRNQVEHTANNWDKLYWPYPGIDPGDPQVKCTLTVKLVYYVPTSDFGLYCGEWDFPGITSYRRIESDENGREIPGDTIDSEETYYVGECGAYDCEPWITYDDGGALWQNFCQITHSDETTISAKTVIGGTTRNRVYRRDRRTGELVECFVGFLVSAYAFVIYKRYPLGAKVNIPKIPPKSCFFDASLYIYCDRLQQGWYVPIEPDPRSPHPPPYVPQGPDRPSVPKENPPDCMQPCTCEDVERLIAKYMTKSIYGHGILDSCSSRVVEWSGDGLQGISKGLEAVVSAINDLGRALCPEVRGNFSLPDCKTGTSNFDYHGKGIQGLSKQLEALAKGLRHTTGELCEARGDIMREVINIPQKVQIQLSDDFALVVGKLNQILSRLGKDDDNIFSKVVQIITLIATLLGLLNDIRALFDRQKDYTPDLESIKTMLKELERLLTPTLQGKIDAITCDGTINSNSWGGEGLEGLNQAITALGVNMAILHSDICELLERKTNEIKPPRLQGSIDAFQCDGTIRGNSWDGEGFDGLNQAITAIGVNLAILHADLCELLDRRDEKELPLLEGKIDAIQCDGTIRSNSWSGKGFDGLNQAITAIGVNLAILHADLCGMLNKKDSFQINEKYKCGDTEIVVQENIDSIIAKELKFLYDHLKRIELLICELEECNAVPVFPGDSIEERNIPAQAVITFVEQKYYPKMSGSKWHVSIPYPKEDLISEQNCWSKFENLIIKKGNVHGTVVWKSPNNTINRFYTGFFGHDENGLREFLERIAGFSRLQKATIRITTGGNPRARPKDVTIQAVKVVVLERDDQGRMVPVKCCRAPKKAGR